MSFINRVPDRQAVARAYDFWSPVYDVVAAPWEYGARMLALSTLPGRVGHYVLDVGIGPGAHLSHIARVAGPASVVCGVDLSLRMVKRAQRRLRRGGGGTTRVIGADALTLPFGDESFDIVFSSYLLDLMPIEAIATALSEFHRVLKPSGRVVLVNLTKAVDDRMTWYERCYRAMPSGVQAYLFGGCRPVRLAHLVSAAGFVEARRTVVEQVLSSEIVVARKSPSAGGRAQP